MKIAINIFTSGIVPIVEVEVCVDLTVIVGLTAPVAQVQEDL